jgi:Cft2 family RNA processing exonuclease
MRIEHAGIALDEFAPNGAPSLITHYHSDHLRGLESAGDRARIICSDITARLLRTLDKVPQECIQVLWEGQEIEVPATGGTARVRALHANHCPGALMFHIESGGRRLLYTGDFRLDDVTRAQARALAGPDVLYVDSTYADRRYRFPPQAEAIAQVLKLIHEKRDASEILLAVYTIGKTNIIKAVVAEFGAPVYAAAKMHRAYCAMGMDRLVTNNKDATRFRAYSRSYFENYFCMSRRYGSKDVAVIIPTGWALDVEHRDPAYHYVPYSEHCDYAELEEFKALVRAKEVVPI